MRTVRVLGVDLHPHHLPELIGGLVVLLALYLGVPALIFLLGQ